MNKNNRMLLRLWIPLLAAAIVLIGFTVESSNTRFLLVIVFLALLVLLVVNLSMRNNLAKALQKESPDDLIHRMTKPLKSGFASNSRMAEAFTAYNTALPLVLYGRHSEATEAMDRVDWVKLEPFYQALNKNIQSLIHYFHGNVAEGLSLAREAKELAAASSLFPGSKRTLLAYEAYIEIGQALNGQADSRLIESLGQKFDKLPFLQKLLISRGLQHAYKQLGDEGEREKMKLFCQKNAPYCPSLQRVQKASA